MLVIDLRPTRAAAGRCSRCDRRCRGYDQGGGVRRWRALDLGTTRVFLRAAAPRVSCREHGVVVAAVPWARPGARFTRSFEDTCAWLTARTTATVVCELLRMTWRSVSAVVDRVIADRAGSTDMLAGLKRIGIDEIAHRRGHRYLTCVVDHDTGRLVWAAAGRNSETLDTLLRGARDGKMLPNSRMSPPTAPNGSTPSSPNGHPRRRCVWIRSTSWPGPRKRWTRSAGRPGTNSAPAGTAGREDVQGVPLGVDEESAGPDRPATDHPGRHREDQRPAVPGIPAQGTAPDGLRRERANPAGSCSPAGSPGPGAAGSPSSSNSPRPSTKFLPLIKNTLVHGMSNARSEATNTHLRTAHPPRLRLPQPQKR